MPNPFTQDAHQLQKGLGLVNPTSSFFGTILSILG
jgi:hypothetical protein